MYSWHVSVSYQKKSKLLYNSSYLQYTKNNIHFLKLFEVFSLRTKQYDLVQKINVIEPLAPLASIIQFLFNLEISQKFRPKNIIRLLLEFLELVLEYLNITVLVQTDVKCGRA